MKRLLKSSQFWNAVIGTAAAIVTYKMTENDTITLAVLGLFTTVVVARGSKDFVKAQNDVQYNVNTKKYEKIK